MLAQVDSQTKELSFCSVLVSLNQMGFELEPDYRISYFKPEQQMFVFLGKVAELENKPTLRI